VDFWLDLRMHYTGFLSSQAYLVASYDLSTLPASATASFHYTDISKADVIVRRIPYGASRAFERYFQLTDFPVLICLYTQCGRWCQRRRT